MNNLEQANAGFMSYIEVSVERRREAQTSTYESFLQLRREYEEKQKELERRAALEEMERKRLQALEAEKGEKEKEGERKSKYWGQHKEEKRTRMRGEEEANDLPSRLISARSGRFGCRDHCLVHQ